MAPHVTQLHYEITEMISHVKVLEMENIKLKEDNKRLSKHLEQRNTEDYVSTMIKVAFVMLRL